MELFVVTELFNISETVFVLAENRDEVYKKIGADGEEEDKFGPHGDIIDIVKAKDKVHPENIPKILADMEKKKVEGIREENLYKKEKSEMITRQNLHKVEMKLVNLLDEKELTRKKIINEFTNLMGLLGE